MVNVEIPILKKMLCRNDDDRSLITPLISCFMPDTCLRLLAQTLSPAAAERETSSDVAAKDDN